mgnify:CR=1 FL=1
MPGKGEFIKLKHTIEKTLSFLLTLAMIFTLVTVPAAADPASPDIGWYSESESTFVLNDGADLMGLAKLVNEGNDFSGKTVKLGADIDLSSCGNWTPIGTVIITDAEILSGGKAFRGTFDGSGYTISGLNCENSVGAAGLFGYSAGTVKDFTLFGAVKGHTCTAGVVAYGSGTIRNVVNEAVVTAEGNYIGGILGDAAGDIVISDCHNKAVVTNGGIHSEESTGRIAGIAGRINSGITASITNCSNTGAITGYQYIGGIVGGSFGNASIQACFNTGNLTGISFGMVHLGGIAGELAGGTIDSCYNLGTVSDTPWRVGHIRSVGGIAGDEEGRDDGIIAITNCYNAGNIILDTSKMDSNCFIYMTGNISGGNNKTDANTMVYENCFYLENTLQVNDPVRWNDVFTENPQAYDTGHIIKCTAEELKSAAVLSSLGGWFKEDSNGGYPVLKWQDGSQMPEAPDYKITNTVSGGEAVVAVNSEAKKGEEVTIAVSDIESGKQIKRVTAVDTAGNALQLVKDGGEYTFTMPGRAVVISVVLENAVAPDAAEYKIILPAELDTIWDLQADSTYYNPNVGTVKAGASVIIIVKKEKNAANTSFTGIDVADGLQQPVPVSAANVKGEAASRYYGEYTFTMPESDVTVTLNETYADFTVSQQKGGKTTSSKTYSRGDMKALAGTPQRAYFSGWSTETTPFIGVSDQYVTLEALLKDAGMTFEKGDRLQVTAADGFTQTYTYASLMDTERSYYSDILTKGRAAEEKTAFAPIFTITSNMTSDASVDPDGLNCDTLNTYRFFFGQSEKELTESVKIVDSLLKNIVSVTLLKADTGSGGETGGESGKPDTSGLDLTSASWDGKSVDVSWYFGHESDKSYSINTAAKLAGAAALVNGLVNSDCRVYTGKEVLSAAKWNQSQYVNKETGTNGENNEATAVYHYGIETFKDKTLKLTKDLDMSGGNYMPLGGQYLMDDEKTATKIGSSFCGVFDGGKHTVIIECDRHCSKNFGDGQAVGFIGRLGVHDDDSEDLQPSKAVVKDLAVEGAVKGNRSVGGIVGKIGKTKNGGVIEGCANFADVTGTDAKGTGGICGAAWNSGTIRDCYNAGTVKNTHGVYGGIAGSNEIALINCFNVGKVTGKGTSAAIATSNGGDTYETCYWLDTSADMGVYNKSVSGVSSKTSSEMKSQDFLKSLGSAFAADTDKINNGYPVFKWQSSPDEQGGGMGGTTETQEPGQNPGVITPAGTYSDVAANAWYKSAVDYVTDKKLMNGTGNGKFNPEGNTTRAMLMTILARLSGENTDGGSPWYQKGLDWSVAKGISDGSNPEKNITREQLAAMLYRYAGSPKTTGNLDSFNDAGQVSDYAKTAMQWAVEKGIVTGKGGGKLDPGSNASRAEVAAMLQRFMNLSASEK